MISELTKQLRRDEGTVLHAYECSAGAITVGIGRNIDQKFGGSITLAEAEYLLSNDIIRVGQELQQNFPWSANLSEPRRGVMMNMLFAMGLTKFSGFKNFLAAMERGDISVAAAELASSKWAQQVGSRASRLRQQLIENTWK